MNALELAEWLEDLFPSDGEPEQAAAMLRRQYSDLAIAHEAIVKLREALEIVSDGDVCLAPITRSIVLEALKDTEEFQ